jgi:hypothetical protein
MKTKLSSGKKNKTETTQLTSPKNTSSAWPPFVEKLAGVLGRLEEDQFLILTSKRSQEFVQFAGQGSYGMRVEGMSNYYRDDAHQLNDVQIAALVDAGWNAPTKDPTASTPNNDPDGSPNFYLDAELPIDFLAVAGLAVSTLVDVFDVSHPGYLEYKAFSSDGNSIIFSSLGLKREIEDVDSDQKSKLPERLLETVRELTNIDSWEFDEDGDIGGIEFGCVTSFVRCLENLGYIHMHAVVCRDVEPTLALLQRVNELNFENGHLHLFVRNNVVVAVSDVLAVPFVSSIIAHGLGNFCQIADELSVILNAEFGEDAVSTNPKTNQVVH